MQNQCQRNPRSRVCQTPSSSMRPGSFSTRVCCQKKWLFPPLEIMRELLEGTILKTEMSYLFLLLISSLDVRLHANCILPDNMYPSKFQGHSSTVPHPSDVFWDLQEVVEGVFTPGYKQCCRPGERGSGAEKGDFPSCPLPRVGGVGSTASQDLIRQLPVFKTLSIWEWH